MDANDETSDTWNGHDATIKSHYMFLNI